MGQQQTYGGTIIRVGIADDYPVVLRGVESILMPCPDMVVKFAAESIARLMECLDRYPVDVLLCDYVFDEDPQADGLNLLRKIRRGAPATRVIFLSAHTVPHIISSALELGAAGFIGKGTSDFSSLPQAIRNVHIGDIYLPPSLSALMLGRLFGGKAKPGSIEGLSEKELAIARMICQGMSISEIADRQCRSPKTISNQKLSAMKKLGVNNDVELSRLFLEIDEH